ncbi:MAG TPA: LysR family transcriptional regulator, partial [Polyangiaceae bacterium]|nr:LysR family transcriptional regulator [Polyangiaceae bacterium]
MEWLNYHHLLYFWTVAREGGLVPAGKVLHVSHPTLSAQIHKLEETLGEKLFLKQGRRLVLTDTGRTVYRYAEEIFSLGREMMDTVKGRATGKPMRLNVGVAETLSKLVVRRLIEPALAVPESIKLVCYEDRYPRLLADLAMHSLDIVLTDAPLPPGSSIKAFNHFLGECGIAFFGTPSLARAHQRNFP